MMKRIIPIISFILIFVFTSTSQAFDVKTIDQSRWKLSALAGTFDVPTFYFIDKQTLKYDKKLNAIEAWVLTFDESDKHSYSKSLIKFYITENKYSILSLVIYENEVSNGDAADSYPEKKYIVPGSILELLMKNAANILLGKEPSIFE